MTINEVGARSGEARPKAPEWEAPGPGSWICDRSHARPGPTPLYRRIVSDQTAPVYRQVFEKYGGAVATLDMQFVNGALYRRLVPLVGADHDNGKPPPRPILWLVSRLHPAFRRRERTARHTLDNETFLDDIDKWVEVERFDWIEGNRELQAVDPADLDDDSLAAHLRTLDARLIQGWRRHHELHANDLGPIGDLLAHAEQSGMDPAVVMQLLRGESPATRDSAHQGSRIAAALRSGGVDPAGVVTVDEIRAVPGASDALDDYLDLYGWRLVTDYDISGSTLHEMSAAVCSIVRSHARPVGQTITGEAGDAVETLRTRSDDPEHFDHLLETARRAYGIRDDNGPLTWAWPAGLMRRAYLETGERLARRGRIAAPVQVFELDVDELAVVIEGAPDPDAAQLERRAAHRAWEATLRGPDLLGPPPAEPDLSALPPALRRFMGLTLAAVSHLEPDLDTPTEPLVGRGIGSETYRGIARVATDPADVVAEMEPGDVLVAAWTAPSYNAVFAIAGGVIVQEGGLLAHAAVMARELGIPAVIGCAGAMGRIKSGDLVEIDPAAGRVTIVG